MLAETDAFEKATAAPEEEEVGVARQISDRSEAATLNLFAFNSDSKQIQMEAST